MNEMFIEIVVSIGVALLGLASAYITLWAKKARTKAEAEIAKIQSGESRDMLFGALEQVDKLVEKTVGAVEQTTAQALRQAVKDGKADREELIMLSRQVYDDVVYQLSPEYEKALRASMGDICNYITNCIEDQVLTVKSRSAA